MKPNLIIHCFLHTLDSTLAPPVVAFTDYLVHVQLHSPYNLHISVFLLLSLILTSSPVCCHPLLSCIGSSSLSVCGFFEKYTHPSSHLHLHLHLSLQIYCDKEISEALDSYLIPVPMSHCADMGMSEEGA